MVIEPSLERVREARELLHGHFGATRVVEAQFLARRTGKRLRLKLETQLRTGSFRVRGAVWALAERLKRESLAGVVASSTGNHGAAVAWTGRSQLLVSYRQLESQYAPNAVSPLGQRKTRRNL